MAYATKQNMIDRYGTDELAQLTDRSNGAVIDDTVLQAALDDGEAEIDTYLAGRYDLPLVSTPAVLVTLNSEIARHNLYGHDEPETVRQRYSDAIRQLRDIANGLASLGLDQANVEVNADDGAPMTTALERKGGRGNLEGF